jgi:hypothetical protein
MTALPKQDNNNGLRKLNRLELLEVLTALSNENDRLKSEVDNLNKQLQDKLLAVENAGSLAEAALAVNGYFADAQAAADQYLENAKAIDACAKIEAERILTDAYRKAAEIIDAASDSVCNPESIQAAEADSAESANSVVETAAAEAETEVAEDKETDTEAEPVAETEAAEDKETDTEAAESEPVEAAEPVAETEAPVEAEPVAEAEPATEASEAELDDEAAEPVAESEAAIEAATEAEPVVETETARRARIASALQALPKIETVVTDLPEASDDIESNETPDSNEVEDDQISFGFINTSTIDERSGFFIITNTCESGEE